jgi:hypothetical protein
MESSRASVNLALEYEQLADINLYIQTILTKIMRGKPFSHEEYLELQAFKNLRNEHMERINGMLILIRSSN